LQDPDLETDLEKDQKPTEN
jgi:hypothetical protein